ncbi:probable indole-3-acetaldehyde oxidase [Coccomyxa sp. Obi]|nr:probable indole-3-acetaldehyde oxidase [Coccomyxa sp. Obi]
MVVATFHTSVPKDGIVFAINGQKQALDRTHLPSATLFDYMRSDTPFTGTKIACGEGGCGSCSVEVYRLDPASGKVSMRCINACLAPVASLDCCSVVTVEGLGDCSKGFHPVQGTQRIAAFHGSQCGFCTPGMAVACHAAITKCHISGGSRQPSAAQMEKALDGNLCRCTGYRPILDACKSFAEGVDMEDLGVRDEDAMSHGPNAPTDLPDDITMPAWLMQHIKEVSGDSKQVTGGGQVWAAPRSLGQLIGILGQAKGQPVAGRAQKHRIVAGNTGAGVYKDWPSGDDANIVDITHVAEMRVLHRTKEGGLLIGAAVTQEELIDCLLSSSSSEDGGAKSSTRASGRHLPRDCPNGQPTQLPSCPNGQPEQPQPNRSGSGSLAGAVNWLLGRSSSAEVKSTDKCDPAAVWTPLAKHLQRIAGNQASLAFALPQDWGVSSIVCQLNAVPGAPVICIAGDLSPWYQIPLSCRHPASRKLYSFCAIMLIAVRAVRAAATIGGNLVLTRSRGLESDLATLLVAAGAQVQTAKVGAAARWRSVEDYLAKEASNVLELVIAVSLPPVKSGEEFWSYKVTQRHWNAHAFINIAVWLSVDAGNAPADAADATSATIHSARVVFGYPAAAKGEPPKWCVGRAASAEKALNGASASVATIAAALRAVADDVIPGDAPDAEFLASTAEGLLFEALAASLKPVGVASGVELPECVLETPSLHDVPLSAGRQHLPDFSRPGSAAGLPLMKERALLQASGEALYTDDMPEQKNSLFAAFVGSTEALAVIKGVDASAALALPGVVAYIGADDVPGVNKAATGDAELLFATDKVEWVGQPIGLIVAESRALATRAAALVQVDYSCELGKPVVTIADARREGTFHDPPPTAGPNSNLPDGQPSALPAVEAAPLQIRGAKWAIPNQTHFYMEPQTAIAKWDEGGVIQVQAATQSTDHVQWAVAQALGLQHNQVNVTCRRAGGGFGGKFSRACPVAAAVAVAAHKLRRQVRLAVNRNQDFRMNNGRAAVEVEYDIGFDESGKILALEMQAYDFPAFHFDLHLCRANLPPHTAVRGPGEIQATMLAEHIVEHVAARLGLDSVIVRERNFLQLPEVRNGDAPAGLKTALGQDVAAHMYTLPRIWAKACSLLFPLPLFLLRIGLNLGCVKKEAEYEKRRQEVDEFNSKHKWVKRGISMTHCRFRSMVPPRPAVVSIFADGSVMVTTAGAELGQGMFTKVAIHELSKALPEEQRPLPMECVAVNDNASFWLPNSGGTAGSTAAEGSCEAVRLACKELVEKTLKPQAAKMGNGLTWAAMISALQPRTPFPPASKLTAYAMWDGTQINDDGTGKKLQYSTFGAACTEVEINVLSGERRVLRADLLHDAGQSISPAVDMGQVEGAFVFGLGMMLQESVTYTADGQPTYDSTWDYKIPSAACIPRTFNIGLLEASLLFSDFYHLTLNSEPQF